MADMKIQKLQNQDEASECARIMSSSEPWITLGRTYEKCMMILNDKSREVYVAYKDNELIGFIILIMTGALTGYIQTLAVKEDYRGQGLGAEIMKFAEDRILAERPNVFICVSSFNPRAQDFYKHLGYELIGELKEYIIPGHSEYLLRKTVGPFKTFKPKEKN